MNTVIDSITSSYGICFAYRAAKHTKANKSEEPPNKNYNAQLMLKRLSQIAIGTDIGRIDGQIELLFFYY